MIDTSKFHNQNSPASRPQPQKYQSSHAGFRFRAWCVRHDANWLKKTFHALPPHPKFCHTIQDATNPLTAYFQPYMDMTHLSRRRILHLNSDPDLSIHFHKQPSHFAVPDFHAFKSPFRNLTAYCMANIVDSSSAEAVHFYPSSARHLAQLRHARLGVQTASDPKDFFSDSRFSCGKGGLEC
jgi:hypothetical protein